MSISSVKSGRFRRIRINLPKIKKKWHNLYGFFLFTQEDENIANYVNKHFSELDNMSGRHVLIFLLEDPNIYKVADDLNIEYNQMPCIAFFKDIKDKELYIYKINKQEDTSEELRNIFTYARKCCEKHKSITKKFNCLKKKLVVKKVGKNQKVILKNSLPLSASHSINQQFDTLTEEVEEGLTSEYAGVPSSLLAGSPKDKKILELGHDVFISYSSKDKIVADATCHFLEQHGIKCWIAPRDVSTGSYAASIVNAIENSKLLVIIFSNNSNVSDQVKNELEVAVSGGITIQPFRIEEVEPSSDMKFYIKRMHWLDALTPPLEDHLSNLVKKISQLIEAVSS